ncbi:MAG: cytochrome ubiquinol oxidase subunit I [Candidatus Helarchaeota archaeon]|nr:cytochrome ubiquinol oxidase subunit I [Candidatus Helarchaeota archaeon]
MDSILLSRIQFGLAACFHFLFPPFTLGLSLIILIIETLYLKHKDDFYNNLSNFLVKILGLVFVVGVATGIVLEFSFGTNWSEFSRFVGDIFGAPLAAEGVFAFFLESVFLGVLIFGRNRVSKKVYWLSAFLVFFGSHISGLWIIIANSWMQTPAGFKIEGGRAVLTNFFQAAINHSTVIRYIHTVIASWITGSLFVTGISAFYIIKKRYVEYAKVYFKVAVIIFIFASIIQLFAGHSHSVQVAKTQPEKMAAFEALWKTKEGAPLALFGIPDSEKEKTYLYVGIPKLLSLLIHGDFNARVVGLAEFPKEEQPPVFLPFVSYHIMIIIGMLFVIMAMIGLYLLLKKKIWSADWYLKLLLYSIPLPHIANQFGWIGAEVGRQPWAVYKILRTANAASVVVPAGQILFSLLVFGLIYIFITGVFIYVLISFVKKGPEETALKGY